MGQKKGERKWNEMITKLGGKRKRRKVKFDIDRGGGGWHKKIFRDTIKHIDHEHDDDEHDDIINVNGMKAVDNEIKNGCDIKDNEELKQIEVEMHDIKQSEDDTEHSSVYSYDEWSESAFSPKRQHLFKQRQQNKFLKLFKRKKAKNKANELVKIAKKRSKHYNYAAASSSDTDSDSLDNHDDRIEISECENKVDGEDDHDDDLDVINDVNTFGKANINHTNILLPSNAKVDET